MSATELRFSDSNPVRAKDLKSGAVYCFKDGRLGIFLGVSLTSEYIFYIVSKVNVLEDWRSRSYFILHWDWQKGYQNQILKDAILVNNFTDKAIESYRSVPSLIGIMGSFMTAPQVTTWLASLKMMGVFKVGIRVIDGEMNSGRVKNKTERFVGAKDLEFGRVYHTTSSMHRSVYVYLGRTCTNGYLWAFVGNYNIFCHSPVKYLLDNPNVVEETKSNKKVHLVTPQSSDSDSQIAQMLSQITVPKDPQLIALLNRRFNFKY